MEKIFLGSLIIPCFVLFGATCTSPTSPTSPSEANIIFLHHSTGEIIWNGGLPELLEEKGYGIIERDFPKDSPYGWENYPYDYWNIWVNHGDRDYYMDEPTLETLAPEYDLIIWKHCYPVGHIMPDTGDPDPSSPAKTVENYKAQYSALKEKMREYPDTDFLVWTGAAMVEAETDPESAQRMKKWTDWVIYEWDEDGDNIHIWDFYGLETGGALYLKPGYSAGDSHPNDELSEYAAPLLAEKITEILSRR